MKPVFSPTFLGLRLFVSVLVISLLPFPFANATAQNSLSTNRSLHDAPVEKATPENVFPTRFGDLKYGKKGIEFSSNRNETELWVGVRLQTRLDTYKGNLASVEDLLRESDADVDLRRGRVKGGGAIGKDWFQVYSEYDFPSNTLLDYRVTLEPSENLSVRAGQWKSEFSRERVDSSGKQQFVERSIANYWFTVDRQKGIVGSVRLFKGTGHDCHLWAGALSGTGRGSGFDSDSGLWLGRIQWNPMGEELPFSQSDLERRQMPLACLAVGTVVGRSPYTRFSSSGGGSLPGFEKGDFNLGQILLESALHYRGVSWQQEFHFKSVEDRIRGGTGNLIGGYAQLGSFLNEWYPRIPKQLELAGRVSVVDPDSDVEHNTEWEYTIAANWFKDGHRNKLTSDISYLDFDSPIRDASQWRFRIQWELSL